MHLSRYKSILTILCVGILALLSPISMAMEFHVAPNGNDAWSGSRAKPNAKKSDGPLATLTGARDAIRAWRTEQGLPTAIPEDSITVIVHEGIYPLSEAFALENQDSGAHEASIEYRAAKGDTVRIIGGRMVTQWKSVSDAAILERMDESARSHVVQANLKSLGIKAFGSAKGGGLEVFFDGQPMQLSRWPNEGFTKIADIVVKDGHKIHGREGSKTPQFLYEGDRASRWVNEPDLWAHGYWFWDWSEQAMKVDTVDTATGSITLSNKEPHSYGIRKGQWYYIYNALSELDQPGEWYLDRENGLLYFWPPKPIDSAETMVSVIPTAVEINNAHHVTIQGFIFEATRGTAIRINGGNNVFVAGCTIQNVGGSAVSVGGGKQHTIIGCDITQTGRGGISLNGGNRTTLEPAGHLAENNHIHHYARTKRTYQSAIHLNGVGNIARNNLIHNAPHMAIGFGGNDHLMEYNEIHSVSYESNDAGAIYTGRNWTMRGNIIRYNYLHHINGFEGKGCMGVYLDDMFSSADVIGNVFYKVTRAAMIGGGRDCKVENNLFVDCKPALHVDARALGWAHGHADQWLAEQKEKGTISGIAYNKPPYSARYPALVTILDSTPKAPEGNSIRKNVSWGGKWNGVYKEAAPYVDITDNLVDVDPLIEDIEKGDFRFKKDSPVHAFGFKPLPLDKMGLYKSRTRASWPVEHEVRTTHSKK